MRSQALRALEPVEGEWGPPARVLAPLSAWCSRKSRKWGADGSGGTGAETVAEAEREVKRRLDAEAEAGDTGLRATGCSGTAGHERDAHES